MKKDYLKYIIIILLLIILILVIKTKVVYVKNDNLHICQKCVIMNGNYYCQTYGLKEDK